jgi:hypothetical protein
MENDQEVTGVTNEHSRLNSKIKYLHTQFSKAYTNFSMQIPS